MIDYAQLGLLFKLYSCEVLFNRGLCYIYLQQRDAGMQDLSYAVKEKVVEDHNVIDEAIREEAEVSHHCDLLFPGNTYRFFRAILSSRFPLASSIGQTMPRCETSRPRTTLARQDLLLLRTAPMPSLALQAPRLRT